MSREPAPTSRAREGRGRDNTVKRTLPCCITLATVPLHAHGLAEEGVSYVV